MLRGGAGATTTTARLSRVVSLPWFAYRLVVVALVLSLRYAGFIRGSQHFYGSTYGATTTVAPDHDFTASKMSKGLPPPPHKLDASKGPQHADLDELPCDRPPGYGGHVPLAKFEYANTFGSTCVDMVSAHKDGEAMFRSGQTVSSSTIAS
jgi:hypothetical protein